MRIAAWVALELLLSAALLSGSVGVVVVALDAPQMIARPCATDTIECVRERIRGMSGQLFPTDPPVTGPTIEGDTIDLGGGLLIRGCMPWERYTRRYVISGGKFGIEWGCYNTRDET